MSRIRSTVAAGRHTCFRRLPLVTALLILGVALPSWSRADNIDKQLIKEAPQLMEYLKKKGYKNIGVLKFRVEQGNKLASFSVGPLNSNMATRVENALILLNDTEKPIGILSDTRQAAADAKLPTYMSPKGRQGLFDLTFPLAWGEGRAKADAFVVGLVQVAPDMRKAKVTLEVFDRESNQLTKVLDFEARSDRTLLTDIGQSFVLSKRDFTPDEEKVNEAAIADAADRDKRKGDDPRKSAENRVSLEVTYNDVKQEMAPDPANNGELRVDEPREGQAVALAIKNIGKEQIGVVLMVNGKNTLFGETQKEPARCAKWILDPNQRYVIKGIYKDEKNYQPFKVLSASETEALAHTDYLGMIHVHVFLSGKDLPMKISGSEPKTPDEPKMQVSRSLTLRGARSATRPPSLKELQEQLRKVTGLVKARGLFDEDKEAPAVADDLQKDQFPNPQLQESLAVRYYKPKG